MGALLAGALLLGLPGCGSGGASGPAIVDTRKPGEESTMLPGAFYVPDSQIASLRAAGVPDSAIIQRDIVRSVCVDELVTYVIDNINEKQLQSIREEVLINLADPDSPALTHRRNFEKGRGYLTLGPITNVVAARGRVRFGEVTNVDEANRLIFVKSRMK